MRMPFGSFLSPAIKIFTRILTKNFKVTQLKTNFFSSNTKSASIRKVFVLTKHFSHILTIIMFELSLNRKLLISSSKMRDFMRNNRVNQVCNWILICHSENQNENKVFSICSLERFNQIF